MARARHTPGEHAGPHGGYPEPDAKHARAAISLAAMHHHPAIEARARAIAERKGFIHADKKSEHAHHMHRGFHGKE